MYDVFGFGAILPGNNMVSHCFPLSQQSVNGVVGILDAYMNNVLNIQFSGPT